MAPRYVVVDGSNIATEGRSLPSLAQLDEAVRELQRELPGTDITVVVDATFEHRINESERTMFAEAVEHGEVVFPPAGVIGRGDAFLLRIAEKTGAVVLSNDSFQEFHGEHPWLFDKGRLIGGKPVPGAGWIFTPRAPVRGPKSREAVKEAKQYQVRVGSKEASKPMPVPKAPPPALSRKDLPIEAENGNDGGGADKGASRSDARSVVKTSTASAGNASERGATKGSGSSSADSADSAGSADSAEDSGAPKTGKLANAGKARSGTRRRGRKGDASTTDGPSTKNTASDRDRTAGATARKAPAPKGRRGRRKRHGNTKAEAVNAPLPFITFIASHSLGETLEGEVEAFTSHGATVMIDGFRCYIPLSGLAEPAPRRAREVLARGERRSFVIIAFDPQRRGVELAMPRIAEMGQQVLALSGSTEARSTEAG